MPELPAYVIALAVFFVLHFALTAIANSVAAVPARVDTWIPILNVVGHALFAPAGYIAAALSERRQILNGLIVGDLASTVVVLINELISALGVGSIVIVAIGTIVGGVGGALSLWPRGRLRQDQ